MRLPHTTCWECRKCRPRATLSAMLRPRRHQLSGCVAPLPSALLCSALNRSPPCAAALTFLKQITYTVVDLQVMLLGGAALDRHIDKGLTKGMPYFHA